MFPCRFSVELLIPNGFVVEFVLTEGETVDVEYLCEDNGSKEWKSPLYEVKKFGNTARLTVEGLQRIGQHTVRVSILKEQTVLKEKEFVQMGKILEVDNKIEK